MRTASLYSSILGSLLLLQAIAGAQADTATANTSKHRAQFKIGVYYNSHLNYYGRTDSLRSSGVFPLAELWLGKGFYINAAPVFVNNEVSGFDYAGTVATVGYRLNKNDKFIANTFFVKPIYKDNSGLVQSALKGQLSSNLTWMNTVLNITAGGDLKWSENLDYGASAGVDHIFRFRPGKGFVIVVDPSAYVFAGTQRFSKTYYKQSNFLFLPGAQQEVTEQVDQFKLLSYELSIPMVIAKGKFQFIINPAYVVPLNLVVVQSRPDLSERGKKMLYTTVGAKVNF